MRIIHLASVVALSVAGAAVAQERSFDGPYVGALFGWQQDRFSATLGNGIGTQSGSENSSGFSYGVVGGYNFNINGNGIIGAEGLISGATNKLSDGEVLSLNSGRTIELAVRGGALISQKTLIFARGGWSNVRFTLPVTGVTNLSSTENGFTLGAGIEHLVASNISLRAEYAYSQYNRVRSGFQESPGVIQTFSIRPTRNAIRAGVAFHF